MSKYQIPVNFKQVEDGLKDSLIDFQMLGKWYRSAELLRLKKLKNWMAKLIYSQLEHNQNQ